MRTKYIISFTVFGLILILSTQPVFSHSGGTDASGCHTNRKTGEYHCHNKKSKIRTQRQKSKTPEKIQKRRKKVTDKVKSKIIQKDSGAYQEGPYKWEDENGQNIDAPLIF